MIPWVPTLVSSDCIYGGTKPRRSQTLSSHDLFMFLQPHETQFGDPGNCEILLCRNPMYYDYDYSTIIGQGLCSPVWFPFIDYCGVEHLTSHQDCINIHYAVYHNYIDIRRIMKQSIQPPIQYLPVKEIESTFGLRRVIKSMKNAAKSIFTDKISINWYTSTYCQSKSGCPDLVGK